MQLIRRWPLQVHGGDGIVKKWIPLRKINLPHFSLIFGQPLMNCRLQELGRFTALLFPPSGVAPNEVVDTQWLHDLYLI